MQTTTSNRNDQNGKKCAKQMSSWVLLMEGIELLFSIQKRAGHFYEGLKMILLEPHIYMKFITEI